MDAVKVPLTHETSPIARVFNRSWLGLVAGAHVLLGRLHAAIVAYRRLLALAPTDERALVALGNLLAQTDDVDAAVAAFRRLLEHHPDNAEASFNLGYLLEKLGELAEAEACFRKAVAIQPALDRAWYGLGLVLIQQGRLEDAAAALAKNTQLQPFNPYGWYQLGMTQHHLGRSAEAYEVYETLRRFEPRYAATLRRDLQTTQRRANARGAEEKPCN